tara:strand:+ start:1188 stop:2609 length:1422 start_codon:yes stop_codon:yes gene_type:complete
MKNINLYVLRFLILTFLFSCKKDSLPNSDIDNEEISDVVLIDHIFNNNDGPDKNPLKGFNSGWWNDEDYASVGFQYLKWKDFEPVNGVFDFSYVEDVISRPGSIGRHLILRLYCDWYGEEESSDGPEWLYSEMGVARLQNDNGKYVTDFNDPNFINESIQAIEQLISYFDNDPRIYSLQIGILGYWGEWHTFGFGEPFYINESSKNKILKTYKDNANSLKIMGRYPWREPLSNTGSIGFHNDYFMPHDHSDKFDEAVNDNNLWLEGPIGGEVPPQILNTEYDEMYSTARGLNMIEKGHYSTMKSQAPPCNEFPNGENCNGFKLMHKKMGYNYQIQNAIFAESINSDQELAIQLEIKNIGVSHMYYNWDLQFALLDQDDIPAEVYDVEFDLTKVFSTKSFNIIKTVNNISKGNYKLGVRIIQPMADKPKNLSWGLDPRNTYILFSNEIEVLEGSWKSDNSLKGGWSILGNIKVN